jgi:hypothetical protein
MALPDPILQSSAGTSFQITVLDPGLIIPPKTTITVSAGGAAVGAGTIPVTITAPAPLVLANITIKDGTYILAGTGTGKQVIVVKGDHVGTATTLNVEPLAKAVTAAATFNTFVGSLPLIGLEGANQQFQRNANTVTLLANQGWESSSYSTGNFQFSGNLYLPTTPALAAPVNRVITAMRNKEYLYVERISPFGDYSAGVCLITDLSDQYSGDGFVTLSATFKGTGTPVRDFIPAA